MIQIEIVFPAASGKIHAILLYSSDYTKEFLEDCSDWFEKDDEYIKIREGKTIQEVREHFLSYISVDILLAMLNENVLKVLISQR